MKPNTIIVEKLVNGGYGLARRSDGQVLLLHNTLPGERVSYSIVAKKKNTLFGHAAEILQSHANRIQPPCPYYGKCGGCDLQHCNYDLQLQLKHNIVNELFSGVTDIILPVLPSPQQFGYRQRIRLQINKGCIGFYAFRSADVTPIKRCLLAHPSINATLQQVLEGKHFGQLCACSRSVEMLYNPIHESVILLCHHTRRPRPADRKAAARLIETVSSLERIFFIGTNFSMEGPITDQAQENRSNLLSQKLSLQGNARDITLQWEAGGFCQVNLEQNYNMIDYILKQCLPANNLQLLDLYCGMGNFSIPLALYAQRIVGAEGQASAIRSARLNSKAAGCMNTKFIKGSIDSICKSLLERQETFDTTLLDPPREGIPGIVSDVAELTKKKIIYVSCDPATLVRDAREIVRKGFSLKSVQPFDMFPQTHHIETVAIFEKN